MSESVPLVPLRNNRPKTDVTIRDKTKVIPHRILGVNALPLTTVGMAGTLEWLKSERLHKYWPIFSHLPYMTIVRLAEGNFDHTMNSLSAEQMTSGARGRILRCCTRLRDRGRKLVSINANTPLNEAADVLHYVLTTPLSGEKEVNGLSIIQLLKSKLTLLMAVHGRAVFRNRRIVECYRKYDARNEIPPADRAEMRKHLQSVSLPGWLRMFPTAQTLPANSPPHNVRPSLQLDQKEVVGHFHPPNFVQALARSFSGEENVIATGSAPGVPTVVRRPVALQRVVEPAVVARRPVSAAIDIPQRILPSSSDSASSASSSSADVARSPPLPSFDDMLRRMEMLNNDWSNMWGGGTNQVMLDVSPPESLS